MFFFFFFSSRRRHTRFDCDWSSDVCSSDLEEAEAVLRDLGFYDVRVRHHELGTRNGVETSNIEHRTPNTERRQLARIEVGVVEMPKLLVGENCSRVTAALKRIGYAHVTLD